MTETFIEKEPCQIHLAPMRGLTDVIYRNTFGRHFQGIDAAMAPFISSGTNPRIDRQIRSELHPDANQTLPVTPQILGNQPLDFIVTVNRLAEMGFSRVNWNLGCPFPMVAKKFRGSGLLPFPDRIDRFLETVMPAISTRLSIKMRLGRKSSQEIFRLIPVLNRYPLESIVIHPRTGIQMYKGAPDLDTFSACTDLLAADVVYNGDIFQLDDFRALSSRFPGIRRWMLGRGVLGNPMLPEEIQGRRSSRGEATDRFRRFHDDLVTAYADRLSGPGHLLGKMKGFWTYFAFFFPQSQTIARRLHHAREWNRFLEITQAVFQNGEGFEDSRGPGLPASGGVQV